MAEVTVATPPQEIASLMAERGEAQGAAQAQAQAAYEAGATGVVEAEPKAAATVVVDPEIVRPIVRMAFNGVLRRRKVATLSEAEERDGTAAFAALLTKHSPTLFGRYGEETAVAFFVVTLLLSRGGGAALEAEAEAEPKKAGA